MPEQTDNGRSKIKLMFLILMFLLPVAGSWYLVFFTDYARDGSGAEHGNLIQPPRQLGNVQLLRINEVTSEQVSLFGKWSMLIFVGSSCHATCEENLYRIRQIRLATGREMKRLQRIAIIDQSESSEFSDYLSKNYPGQLYVSKKDLGEGFLSQFHDLDLDGNTAIFLIDTRGFLMMRYPGDTEPTGIIRDLKRLLRISA